MPAPRPRPRPVALGDLASVIGLHLAADAASPPVTGIVHDSRDAVPGDLYVALPGRTTHGARFARAAVGAGAVAIVTDPTGATQSRETGVPVLVVPQPRVLLGDLAAAVYGQPARHMQMIGITGTNGKTTVAAMVDAGLRAAGRVTGVIGTIGVQVAGTAYAGVRTTPEATDLQGILGFMHEAQVTTVVMEVSSIALEEHRVDGLVYDVAAFTNLSQDHLDYHGTMSAYYDAKARLFTPAHSRVGVIGIDDGWGARLEGEASVPVRTWSTGGSAATWTLHGDDDGWNVSGPEGERQLLDVAMPGAFNRANALCAYAVLREAGVPAVDAARGIASAHVPGRMQVVADVAGVLGIVDYAHSPDAIERVLESLAAVTSGRLIAVVGAGGDRDAGKRQAMGAIAARLADVLVITDDNPRSEDPAAIRSAVREGASSVVAEGDGAPAEVREVADRGLAITVAVAAAEAGDVVVVLGKGHEQGQEVAGVITPFDDASVLSAALREGPGA